MKLKLTLIGLLLGGCVFTSFAGPKDNYGTDACTQLVVRANALYEKGKYADAKVLYEQALATGDSYYTKKCTTQLRIINNLLGNQRPATKATVFTISQDTVKINYLGGDYPVHVDGTNWKAMTPGNEDWCKIEVDQKRGTVKIFCSKNESVNDRSTFVTITNGNGKKKTVAVINEGSPEILRSSAQNLVFTPDGETSVVDIDANTDWNIAGVPGWLQAIKGVGDIQFTAKPNDENKDRIAQVKVETPSKQKITINIIQGATLDSLAFNKNNLQFGPEGGDEYIHVLTNADDWRFGDFPHWCQLERVNNNTIRVHCTPNEPVDMPREASVNVTTGTQTLGINVFQAPKPIVHIIPTDGVGGRRLSFGFSAGYVNPMIGTSASSKRILSPVNYMQGPDAKSADYKSSGGFNIGAFADLCLYKNLYLIAGLDFIYYKYKEFKSAFDKVLCPYAERFSFRKAPPFEQSPYELREPHKQNYRENKPYYKRKRAYDAHNVYFKFFGKPFFEFRRFAFTVNFRRAHKIRRSAEKRLYKRIHPPDYRQTKKKVTFFNWLHSVGFEANDSVLVADGKRGGRFPAHHNAFEYRLPAYGSAAFFFIFFRFFCRFTHARSEKNSK